LSEDGINANDTPETSEPPGKSKKQDRKEYQARYYAENKDEIARRKKAVREARREEINAAERERLATDPAAHEQRIMINRQMRKNRKERIATDPEEKKRHEERLKKRRERHAERLITDPEYQRQRDEFTKSVREKRQKEQKKGEDEP
jgi:hypothetical protein